MSPKTLPPTNEPIAKRLLDAWREAEARAYLNAFKEVRRELDEMEATHLLAMIVNTMLDLMAKRNLNARAAAHAMMSEMSATRSRMFVMAAAVDVLLHDRKPGSKVEKLPTMEDTLRLAMA
jgi:hypothetical protein